MTSTAPLIGHRLRVARTDCGIPQHVLAVKLGVNTSTIRRWEDGSATPPASRLAAITEALGVSVEWLVLGDGTAAGAA